ncbi:MAG TPA: FKBP-type peptidyl-prolyl cis-trans isomerase [Anaeromyxobacteraceae bacterium]|nr:FKBP-type peptidyl-prolyl cis-trans isomerase [Anaeromyxobacteraceae bacterium]
MRKVILSALVLSLAASAHAQTPKTEDEKTLYAIGVLLAKQLAVLDFSPAELEMVRRGFVDATSGKKVQVEPEAYQQQINRLAQGRRKLVAEKEKEKSKAFLEAAAKEKGAQQTPTGLIYVPIKEGTGPQPKENETVKVQYTGKFIDGRVFDSSLKRGQPAELTLNSNQIIKCWAEGIAKMKVGGKAKLICPSSTAYGEEGTPIIPGGATLVFDVELLGVKK